MYLISSQNSLDVSKPSPRLNGSASNCLKKNCGNNSNSVVSSSNCSAILNSCNARQRTQTAKRRRLYNKLLLNYPSNCSVLRMHWIQATIIPASNRVVRRLPVMRKVAMKTLALTSKLLITSWLNRRIQRIRLQTLKQVRMAKDNSRPTAMMWRKTRRKVPVMRCKKLCLA